MSKKVFLLLFRISTFVCFLSFLSPSYSAKAAHYPWLDLGYESEAPLALAAGTTLLAIGSGAIACERTRDSCECGRREISGRFGLHFPGKAFGTGPTMGSDVYFRIFRTFKIGFGYSFSELQNAPVFEQEEVKYSLETGEVSLQVVKYKLESDTYVGSFYLSTKIASGRGRNCYAGVGVGFFYATSDRLGGEEPVKGYETFGKGVSYQVFAGIMSKRAIGKARLSAEIRLSIMKSSNNTPDSVFEEKFLGTDFGGLSITGGMVF